MYRRHQTAEAEGRNRWLQLRLDDDGRVARLVARPGAKRFTVTSSGRLEGSSHSDFTRAVVVDDPWEAISVSSLGGALSGQTYVNVYAVAPRGPTLLWRSALLRWLRLESPTGDLAPVWLWLASLTWPAEWSAPPRRKRGSLPNPTPARLSEPLAPPTRGGAAWMA